MAVDLNKLKMSSTNQKAATANKAADETGLQSALASMGTARGSKALEMQDATGRLKAEQAGARAAQTIGQAGASAVQEAQTTIGNQQIQGQKEQLAGQVAVDKQALAAQQENADRDIQNARQNIKNGKITHDMMLDAVSLRANNANEAKQTLNTMRQTTQKQLQELKQVGDALVAARKRAGEIKDFKKRKEYESALDMISEGVATQNSNLQSAYSTMGMGASMATENATTGKGNYDRGGASRVGSDNWSIKSDWDTSVDNAKKQI